jgi:pimeloyl-ACP methyl ester carboxylesterase
LIEKRLEILGFKCRVIFNRREGLPIVFLHGYSFTSEIWETVNVFKLLTEKEIPFLAIDMPYGLKSECKPKTRDPGKNINLLKEAISTVFQQEKLFIIGASLGGNIALKYSCQFPVEGMLLIAPVSGLTDDLVNSYNEFEAPVYVLYGTKDRIVSLEEMKKLEKAMLNAKLIIYKEANHPAYLDKPDDFKKHLLEIYGRITS